MLPQFQAILEVEEEEEKEEEIVVNIRNMNHNQKDQGTVSARKFHYTF